jgi:hypothetical protein
VQPEQLRAELLRVLRGRYPTIEIEVAPWDRDPARLAVRFVEPSFAGLYLLQRYHQLVHLIPAELRDRELSNAVWFELAPGERPEDLRHPDEELTEDIAEAVLAVLARQRAFEALDDLLCPTDPAQQAEKCAGDFRLMRGIVQALGHDEDAQFDIFHVLMASGGFCDCEILANAAGPSRFKSSAWRSHEA